jgi:hypothetical protein
MATSQIRKSLGTKGKGGNLLKNSFLKASTAKTSNFNLRKG